MNEAPKFEPKPADLEALFPTKLLEAQERNVEILTSANEIVVKTAKAIGENQTELLRLEAEQASKAFIPLKFDKDIGSAIAAYGTQWHENSEKLISQMRAINDLAFDCGWQLFKLCADSFRQPPIH
jgi:hypothetical protein